MRKRCLIGFGICLLVLLFYMGDRSVHAAPVSGSCGKNATYVLDDRGTLTISGSGAIDSEFFSMEGFSKSESVRKLVVQKGITDLGSMTFEGYDNMTSVEIPEGVKELKEQVFSLCTSLVDVSLPEGLTEIQWRAFSCCYKLRTITLPDSVQIIEPAFMDCYTLQSIRLPEKLTTLYPGTFSGCEKLMNIYVDSDNQQYCSVKGVLYSKNKKKLVCVPNGRSGSFVVPKGVESIENEAFAFCEKIKSLTLYNKVVQFGDEAFYTMSALRNIYYRGIRPEWKKITGRRRASIGDRVKIHYTGYVKKIKIIGPSKKVTAGKKIRLRVRISPTYASIKKVRWTSNNRKLATVTQTGIVRIGKRARGKKVKITAWAKDGSKKKAVFVIRVKKRR